MTDVRCRLGLHAWPRLHGSWREPVVQPANSECPRCSKPLNSVWRTAYPADGSYCPPGSCALHTRAEAELGSL